MNKNLTLALSIALLTTGAAIANPSLKGDISVNADIVTVGDMFDDPGDLSSTPIFRAPSPGTTGIVPIADIAQAAKGAASIWKTYYNGSVGGQAIMGIPLVRRLKDTRGETARVWPFETGLKTLAEADLAGVDVVFAEVYPSMVKPQGAAGEVKDLMQVRTLAEHFARLDAASKLGELFAAPKGTPADAVLDAEREEGWILGAGA